MVRIIVGVIIGFVVWSVLWMGSDQVLITLSPGWYASHQYSFQIALQDGSPFAADSLILLIGLVRSVIISLMAGFLAAFVAGENRRSPLYLGLLLLLVGILVQGYAWNYMPLWYHAIFLILLVPVTVIGGRLRPSS